MPVESNLKQGERWQFDAEVTAAFDDMLARSIPQYPVMRQAVTDMASRFVRQNTHVIDLGCSRGEAMAPLIEKFGASNTFVGVETSEPMAAAAEERFKGYAAAGIVKIVRGDLRTYYPPWKASATLAVLTLQFVPIEYRPAIVRKVYEHTEPGGAFIAVEKVIASSAEVDAALVDLYHANKRACGYSQDEIDRKRFSLEGVLVPVTARWNEDMLASAGFSSVECFWRFLNFAAWVAIKRPAA